MSKETVIVKLREPHEFDKKECSELTMRKPLVGDQVKASRMGETDGEQEAFLFAHLCKVKYEDFAKMPFNNYKAFQDAYKSFFRADGENLKTSDTASSSSQE